MSNLLKRTKRHRYLVTTYTAGVSETVVAVYIEYKEGSIIFLDIDNEEPTPTYVAVKGYAAGAWQCFTKLDETDG